MDNAHGRLTEMQVNDTDFVRVPPISADDHAVLLVESRSPASNVIAVDARDRHSTTSVFLITALETIAGTSGTIAVSGLSKSVIYVSSDDVDPSDVALLDTISGVSLRLWSIVGFAVT